MLISRLEVNGGGMTVITLDNRIKSFIGGIPAIKNLPKMIALYDSLATYQKTVQAYEYELDSKNAPSLAAQKELLKDYIPTLTMLKKYADREIIELKEAYSLSSISSYLTQYRKAVKEKYKGNHPVIIYLSLSKSDYGDLLKLKTNAKRQATEQRVTFGRKDVNNLIEQATRMCMSQNYYIAALGVMALTGRRAVEIFKTGDFEKANSPFVITINGAALPVQLNGFDLLMFSGQAKKKGKSDSYLIPVLGKADLIVDTVQRLRSPNGFVLPVSNPINKVLKATTLDHVNTIVNKPLSREFQKSFCSTPFASTSVLKEKANKLASEKPHILRHVYTNFFSHEIGRVLKRDFNFVDVTDTSHKMAIMKSLLGHSDNERDEEGATKAYESYVLYEA